MRYIVFEVLHMYKTFGETIASLRRAHGMRQQALAEAMAEAGMPVSNQAVSKWENDATLPNAQQFLTLCRVLDVDDIAGTFSGGDAGGLLAGLNAEGRRRALEYIALLHEIKNMFLSIGFGSITVVSPEQHDRIIAYTSQLAHVVASAYIKSPTALEHTGMSAGSYKDMTRVASLNSKMWSELFLENSDNLLNEIDNIINNLKEYRDAIAANDRAELEDLLEDGTKRKAVCG